MPQDRCPHCREIIEPGSRFCGNCGRALPAPSAAPAAKTLFMGSGAAVLEQVNARLAEEQRRAPSAQPSKAAPQKVGASAPQQPAPQAPSQPVPQQPAPQAPSQPVPQQPAPQAPSHPVPRQPVPQAPSQPVPRQPAPQAPSQPVPRQPAPVAPSQHSAPHATLDATTENRKAAKVEPGPMAKLRATGSLLGVTLNNRYEVLERIGEGGFGTIYLAKQIQMGREVALKVLNPYMSDDPKLVERFRREAKAACNLKDPHTIITYDFDQTPDGVLYLAMEYLRGRTLFDLLEEAGGLTVERTLHILSQCCSSLAEAHQRGIVHRDIKPENIFLEERPGHTDYVKILDFGIAKIVSGDAAQSPALTAAGQTLGTLEYMSPEQLTGKPLDGRSDIYALGILAYEMLTGTFPFQSDNPATIISGHLREQPKPPSVQAPEAGIPEALDRIILKMLAKNREERYEDAISLKRDLDALVRSSGTLRAVHGENRSRGTGRIALFLALGLAAAGATALGLYLAGVF